jgi:hypothetical protein
MSLPRRLLVSGVVAVAGLAAAVPTASAEPTEASCAGVLSVLAAQQQLRDEFAPLPSDVVVAIAQQHGDLAFCSQFIPPQP